MKLLTPLIFIALAAGLFFMVVNPQYLEVKELQEQIEANSSMITLATQLRDEQTKLQDKNKAISDDERQRLEKILPNTVDNVRLILDIDNIANDPALGISIKNIGITGEGDTENGNKSSAIGDISGNRDFGVIQLNFAFSSEYERFKDFIKKLEDSLRLVDIVELKVSPTAVSGVYDYSVKLNTYWLK